MTIPVMHNREIIEPMETVSLTVSSWQILENAGRGTTLTLPKRLSHPGLREVEPRDVSRQLRRLVLGVAVLRPLTGFHVLPAPSEHRIEAAAQAKEELGFRFQGQFRKRREILVVRAVPRHWRQVPQKVW